MRRLKSLGKHVNPASVMAFVALIFAMTGGAYAAIGSGHHNARKSASKKKGHHGFVITSKQQIKPNVLKQLQGNAGPAGPAGPAGATGPVGPAGKDGINGVNGKDGTNGTNGSNGVNGKSVALLSGSASKCGAAAGYTYEIEGSGKQQEVCNGEKGSNGSNGEGVTVLPVKVGEEAHCNKRGGVIVFKENEPSSTGVEVCNGEPGASGSGGGFPATLPKGSTETGTWQVSAASAKYASKYPTANISFSVQLEKAPTEVVAIGASATTAQKEKCSGTELAPTATEGVLCIYDYYGGEPTLETSLGRTSGAFLIFAEGSEAFGTFAVMAA